MQSLGNLPISKSSTETMRALEDDDHEVEAAKHEAVAQTDETEELEMLGVLPRGGYPMTPSIEIEMPQRDLLAIFSCTSPSHPFACHDVPCSCYVSES